MSLGIGWGALAVFVPLLPLALGCGVLVVDNVLSPERAKQTTNGGVVFRQRGLETPVGFSLLLYSILGSVDLLHTPASPKRGPSALPASRWEGGLVLPQPSAWASLLSKKGAQGGTFRPYLGG